MCQTPRFVAIFLKFGMFLFIFVLLIEDVNGLLVVILLKFYYWLKFRKMRFGMFAYIRWKL
jgi:hypothetical protein